MCYKEEQFIYEMFFCSTLTFRDNKHRYVGTSLKFALMDCYGHIILVKMCYAIVRKRIFSMELERKLSICAGFVESVKSLIIHAMRETTRFCHCM